jgi:hypothetical protein
MVEEIISEMLENSDFEYVTIAQLLIRIKPDGW